MYEKRNRSHRNHKNHKNHKNNKNDMNGNNEGMTLLECILAISILSVLMLGFALVFSWNTKALSKSFEEERARMRLAERIRDGESGGEICDEGLPMIFEWDGGQAEIELKQYKWEEDGVCLYYYSK